MQSILSMQREITEPSELLDRNGHLLHTGWMKSPILYYNRKDIGVGWHRIKEWDYYAVIGPKYGITFTVADLGILSLFSIVWLDFEQKTFETGEVFKLLTRGKTGLPRSSEKGNIHVKTKGLQIDIQREGDRRVIEFNMPNFQKGKSISGQLILQQDEDMESMVIATPWAENQKAFYYNQKINCMPTKGIVNINDEQYVFDIKDSFAVLDWGRGVWTYRNTWYWGSASGTIGDTPFGFNIGYGFGDTSAATENMVFYDNKAHKLDQVEFIIGEEDYLKPWKFTSNDKRFEMDFEPILDRSATVNLLLFKSDQHQVFGYYSGYVILDNGEKIEVNRLLGFAEEVYNRW